MVWMDNDMNVLRQDDTANPRFLRAASIDSKIQQRVRSRDNDESLG